MCAMTFAVPRTRSMLPPNSSFKKSRRHSGDDTGRRLILGNLLDGKNMDQITGNFKLISRGIDGYDLLFSRIDGVGGTEQRRGVATPADAIEVLERVLGRELTAGEKETLAIGNGLVAMASAERFRTYF
jgi:hypothetical protein